MNARTVMEASIGMFSSSFSYVRRLRKAALTTMRRKLWRSCTRAFVQQGLQHEQY